MASPDALELLQLAPTTAAAASLSVEELTSALRRARRRNIAMKAENIATAFS